MRIDADTATARAGVENMCAECYLSYIAQRALCVACQSVPTFRDASELMHVAYGNNYHLVHLSIHTTGCLLHVVQQTAVSGCNIVPTIVAIYPVNNRGRGRSCY